MAVIDGRQSGGGKKTDPLPEQTRGEARRAVSEIVMEPIKV